MPLGIPFFSYFIKLNQVEEIEIHKEIYIKFKVLNVWFISNICELINNATIIGEVRDNCHNKKYSYSINTNWYTENGVGMSQPNIIRIISMKTNFKGIAQKQPNINLDDFVNQTVLIVNRVGEKHIAKLKKDSYLDDCYFPFAYNSCRKDGYSYKDGNLDIMEIYGEGAYEVNMKSTFDEPEDKQIQEAKQLLHKMSEEQIARLLKSLKQ